MMAVMNITDVGMFMLDRCMLMLMGMPIGALGWPDQGITPWMLVAVVGVSSRLVVPVAVGMA